MSIEEYYVLQPYELTERGRCFPLDPIEVANRGACLRKAKSLAKRHGGAEAIRFTVHYPFNQFDASIVIGEFGVLPDGGFTIA